MTLEELAGGRTLMRVVSVVHDVESRDAFLASGMEGGMNESYERLDELLAARAVTPAAVARPLGRGLHRAGPRRRPRRLGRTVPRRGVARPRRRPPPRRVVPGVPASPAPGSGCRPVRSVDDDPVAAWTAHRDGVQALLDDPATADLVLANPHIGDVPLPEAVDRFYTADVFMHTWDLARATGQDETLDEARCRELYEGMLPMEERAAGRAASTAATSTYPTTPTCRPGCWR